jgi:hypothetical protein
MVGEVKHLDRGKLYFKTDSTGTIEIDWADVTKLVTHQTLRIERRSGGVSFASFADDASDGRLAVVTQRGMIQEPIEEIVAFHQFEAGFWDRLDVSTSLGYSFTKANGVQQLNFSAKVGYDTEKRSWDLAMSAQESDSDSAERTKRRSLDLQSLRYGRAPFFTGWKGTYEDNEAHGLDHRILVAWLAGREFYPMANQRLRFFGGINLGEERVAGGNATLESELLIGGSIDWYKFRSPELDLSSQLIVFPSITEFGRVRSSFDTSLRWEIYEDLFWELTFYHDYDSDSTASANSGSSGTSNNDYGVTTSLGWSW